MSIIPSQGSTRVQATPAYELLVVQDQGEQIHTELTHAGWTVVHHTNDPMPWLDDIENALRVNAIIVSVKMLGFATDEASDDVVKCINMLPTYLFMEDGIWLELTLEDENDE